MTGVELFVDLACPTGASAGAEEDAFAVAFAVKSLPGGSAMEESFMPVPGGATKREGSVPLPGGDAMVKLCLLLFLPGGATKEAKEGLCMPVPGGRATLELLALIDGIALVPGGGAELELLGPETFRSKLC